MDERLVRWDDEQLGPTTYALDKFIASSDKIPRCFKILDWSSEVCFDLITRFCADHRFQLLSVAPLRTAILSRMG